MTQRSATEYLIRTVLDEGFREKALAEPAAAMVGYDLSKEEKDILLCRDHRLLALLGASIMKEADLQEPQAAATNAYPQAAGRPTLPAVELLLRLTPQTSLVNDGTPQVSYAASLQSWPPSMEARSGKGDEEQDDNGLRCEKSPGITWIVRLLPTVLASEATGLRVAYSATIHPIDLATPRSQGPPQDADAPALRSPWRHDTESAEVRDAAQTVLSSPGDERYERLLALIEVMQAGDHRA